MNEKPIQPIRKVIGKPLSPIDSAPLSNVSSIQKILTKKESTDLKNSADPQKTTKSVSTSQKFIKPINKWSRLSSPFKYTNDGSVIIEEAYQTN